MAHARFVHLRVHSAYSLLEGAIKIPDLVNLCRAQAMPAVAVTDSGNLFGVLEFAFAARAAGVQPIVGCQMALGRDRPNGSDRVPAELDSLVLLVQNEAGYRNLLKLVSRAYLQGPEAAPPQIAIADLEALGAGLIALTGGADGPIGSRLRDGQTQEAEQVLLDLARLFPGRLYVELARHGRPEEAAIEDGLLDLATRHDLPLVATNEAFFADARMYEAHDALLCVAEGTYVAEGDRRRVTPEHRFKTAEEMRQLFADLPEAIDNTLVIALRCAFAPEAVAPILPAFPTKAGRSEAEELRARAESGLEKRLDLQVYTPDMEEETWESTRRRYRERLNYELGVIEQMGFPGYFLIVADFIQWAKQQEIPVGPGRGSGAGSVVSWALTITDLDPLRWGLLFERFLNPERVSMPDFDIDFCQERRDEVIRYVQKKYGHGRVAQIITFGTLQARAALRDIGRVLQMPYSRVDRICKLVPNNPANPVSLQQAIDAEPQLQEMRADDEAVARLMDIALKLEGLYRHASTHAAGVVIGDRPLDELIPLYRDPRSEMPITGFSMKYVEQAGLVKFDFLGLKTLTILDRACRLIADAGPPVELSRIPLDDPKTYEMLGRGATVGIFQLESSGMRDVLRRLEANRFEDIIAVVALFRPGPMDNIPSFLARKQGREAIDYLHPSLEGILKETFGIMVYQEQVMQIAQELSGYSLGGADLLRRAMGKKIKSEMAAQRKNFIDGAVARAVPEAKAEQIFEQVDKFAGYGFPKGHAAAYALVTYQTAYLKANHPVEFLAASMTLDMSNTDKLNLFRQELLRLGIALLPPDINRSRAEFAVEPLEGGTGKTIRYALAAIKNVGETAMRSLVEERDARGPFTDIDDFAGRVEARIVNKRQIESLACAGAFDGINLIRRQIHDAAEAIVRHAAAAANERSSAQENLFGADSGAARPRLDLPPGADWPAVERLRHEFDAVGFYLSAHPLDAFEPDLKRLGVIRHADLAEAVASAPGRKRLAGIVLGKQERTSRQGKRFAFVQVSDTSGAYEVVVFSELLARSRDLLESGAPLCLNVDIRSDGSGFRLSAQEITPLERMVGETEAGIRLFLGDRAALESLSRALAREAPGRCRISLVLDLANGREVELALPERYRLSPAMRQAIKAVSGLVLQEE